MLKVGIYVDSLNIMMNGGYGIRYDVLYRYAELQGPVLRANAYLCEDRDRKKDDSEYRSKITLYHKRLRQCGFKVLVVPIQKYLGENNETLLKANVDMDLALDVIQQGKALERILLLSGDGDFARLVEMVQNYGCRVEVLAFQSVSTRLAAAADVYTNGYLVPGLLPTPSPDIQRGVLVRYNSEKGFGFLRCFQFAASGLTPQEIFFHVSEVDNQEALVSERFTPIFEFKTAEGEEGKPRAVELRCISQDSNL
ncbi:MAG: NYN domain-containing protein [Planctomycetes bacterium]|nr:NYN domain-containing protein [Planctomycetota bacterium]